MKQDLNDLIEVLAGPPDTRIEIWGLYWEARTRLRLMALDAYRRATAHAIEHGYQVEFSDDAFKHVAQDLHGPMPAFSDFLNVENIE